MNVDEILEHLQANAAAYAIGGVTALIIIVAFYKYVKPVLYHTAEYLLYCTVVHMFLAGFVRAFSWFREETQFKNFKGDLDPGWSPYTTPVTNAFWKKEFYNPEWLFWVEVGLAAFLLYVVIVIRPVRLKHKAVLSKKPKPGEISSGSYKKNPGETARKLKSARSR